jgi:hypothetical protein
VTSGGTLTAAGATSRPRPRDERARQRRQTALVERDAAHGCGREWEAAVGAQHRDALAGARGEGRVEEQQVYLGKGQQGGRDGAPRPGEDGRAAGRGQIEERGRP